MPTNRTWSLILVIAMGLGSRSASTSGAGAMTLLIILWEVAFLVGVFSALVRETAGRRHAHLLIVVSFFAFPSSGLAAAQETTAIVGATLFDGTGAPSVANTTIVVEGGRIAAVGPRTSVKIPPGARVFDASGKHVIPGLADMHNHMGHVGFGRAVVAEVARELLGWGLTTVLNPAGVWTEYDEAREVSTSGLPVPRIYHVGQIFGAPAGWGGNGYAPESIPGVHAAIDELSERGADAVKLVYDDVSQVFPRSLPMMSREIMEAIIRSAHEHGLKAFVHALELEPAKEVLRAGADGLVHAVVDTEVDGEFLSLLRESGAVYVSTQGLFEAPPDRVAFVRRLIEIGPNGLADRPVYEELLTNERFRSRPNRVSKAAMARANLKAVFEAGIPVVIGTDTGADPGLVPGIATHMELLLHVEAGIPPADVLQAATRNAARMLGREHEWGTVEVGKLADLLILDADPVADIRNTVRIHRIVKGGVFYDPAELRR